MTKITEFKTVEFVEIGEEYGFFGHVVARTEVAGMTEAEVAAEVAAMHEIVGAHTVAVYVEEVKAVA
jgi:hypothetical protein